MHEMTHFKKTKRRNEERNGILWVGKSEYKFMMILTDGNKNELRFFLVYAGLFRQQGGDDVQ